MLNTDIDKVVNIQKLNESKTEHATAPALAPASASASEPTSVLKSEQKKLSGSELLYRNKDTTYKSYCKKQLYINILDRWEESVIKFLLNNLLHII